MIQRNGAYAQPPLGQRMPSEALPPGRQPSSWNLELQQWVGRRPATCVAAALILGAAIGWLIKRR